MNATITKNRTLFLVLFSALFCCWEPACALPIDTLIAQAPREVLPIIDRTARLDMLDLYNNGLTAKVENIYGGQAQMLTKTSDYAFVETSDAGTWQIKLLPAVGDHDTLICSIISVKAGGTGSQMTLWHQNWKSVAKQNIPRPAFEQFYVAKNSLSPITAQSTQAALRELPVEIVCSDSSNVVTFRLSTDCLSEEEKQNASLCTREVRYEWVNGKFALKSE